MFMNFMLNLFLIGAASGEPAGRKTGLIGCSHDIMDAKMTSALTPALSPRRGGIVRRSFENLYDWIGGTLIRKPSNNRKLFPLLGERIKGEGGRKYSFHWKHRGSRWFILAGAITAAALLAVLLAPVERKTFRGGERLAQVETPKAVAKQLVREPAVAGLFYPKDPAELSRMIDRLLAAAPVEPVGDLKAIVCPHAGYEFSGPVAAYSFKNLIGRHFDTVIILGPSHYALFDGASVPAVDAYRTPLGLVPISPKARALAKISPCLSEPFCPVQRPAWWQQSSKPAPDPAKDTPDTWEHSAEVQVPFLQKVLTNFAILPVVFGNVDPAQVAQAVATQLDDKTLLVVSSDLSHYHPYDEAKALDTRCVKAMCSLDIGAMESQEACGKLPILTLLHLAHQNGWQARLLDYRNSGDTSGDKSHGVVGYAAIAFYAPAQGNFNPTERTQLLELARRALKEAVAPGRSPVADTNNWPAKFRESRGCFVTLTEAGALRGCIGHIFPQESLYRAIQDNARSAALEDPRFRPVQPGELNQLEIEISVLTEPKPLPFTSPEDLLAKLQPGKDGVVLKLDGRGATYLPQVWEQLPDKVEFLNHLSEKGGGAPGDWRKPGTSVLIYHVEAFKESEK
jgi:AmmeMemoRadiSam system protein B/AmmeMemoRadiSam system protein A